MTLKSLIPLVFLALLLSCDRTEINSRKIVGEWVIDSIFTPVPVFHLMQINSRLVFDSKKRFGLFTPDATERQMSLRYSISRDELTIWVSDQGLSFEIEKLTDKSLVLRQLFAEGDEKNLKIYLRKAE